MEFKQGTNQTQKVTTNNNLHTFFYNMELNFISIAYNCKAMG